LHYIIKALDVSGLWNTTGIITIDVVDIVEPDATPEEDIICYVGDELMVQIGATDNIGIASYVWEGAPIEVTGNTLEMIPSEQGTYGVTVTVADHQGNSAEIDFTITVLSRDYDTDEDGIPDLVETENDLDMNDPSDASDDKDADGLSNLQEFTLGTNITSGDTDDDGMPDKWEIDNGLDPITPSSENDEDKDGRSDLKEYLEGTDPLVSDVSDDKINILIPIIILAAIVLAIILVIALFIIIKKVKNKNTPVKENEEVMSWD
jgi:hypothetical protein